MPKYVDLSTTLLTLRKQKGITQKELGKALGVTNKTVSKWENGIFLPDITCLVAIADYYQISVDELLRGDIRERKDEVAQSKEKKTYSKSGLIYLVLALIFVIGNFQTLYENRSLLIFNGIYLGIMIILIVLIFIFGYIKKKR